MFISSGLLHILRCGVKNNFFPLLIQRPVWLQMSVLNEFFWYFGRLLCNFLDLFFAEYKICYCFGDKAWPYLMNILDILIAYTNLLGGRMRFNLWNENLTEGLSVFLNVDCFPQNCSLFNQYLTEQNSILSSSLL